MAIHLAKKGHEVTLWAFEADLAARMEAERENATYLPSFRFPPSLHVTTGTLGDASLDFLVNAVPTQHMRGVYTTLGPHLPTVPLVSLSKGIEIGTGRLPTQIYRDVVGADRPAAALTGPCIAREVARGMPTAVVVAGDEPDLFQAAFNSDRFRVYTSDDRLGAELGGALKNVLGLTAGMVDGMKLGDNAKAAVLTRGIVEIARLGVALGAHWQTFNGLAGFGDLFTTCVSPFGRNRTVGERIGKGEKLDDILASMKQVAEGVPTTRAVVALAREHGIEMPIAQAVFRILFEGLDPESALDLLMTRDSRAER